MKVELTLEKKPETFKDIFKGATQELQAIAERRTAKMFPPFDLPAPKKLNPLTPEYFDAVMKAQEAKPALAPVDVSKYSDPKFGFFGESFARMLNAELARKGRLANGPETQEG